MEEIRESQSSDKELNNILLDKDDSNSSGANSKKILVIGAAVFIVLIVVVAIMRAVNSSDDKDSKTLLPPEPKEKKEVDNSPLFKKIPVEDNKEIDEKFEKIINEIKSKTNNTPVPEPKKVEPVTKPKPVVAPVENKVVVPKPKEEIIKSKPMSSVVYKSTNSNKDGQVNKGFYIQVGAFYSLKPSPILLNNIKSKGFDYAMYKTKVNSKDVTKVIIGPFPSKEDARGSLMKVKEKINASAYILKIN
jgi:DedD protein